MVESLSSFLAWPFVWRAIIAGVLISLCASLLGVTLVLRRLSFMGDGLSHVAFGAMAVAGVCGLSGGGMAVTLPLTAICAVQLLRGGIKTRGDAALAMLSVGAMAAGYLLMNAFPSSSNVSGDVCTTLFGAVSLLTLTNTETWLCAAISVSVIIFHLLTYHCNFDIAFDEEFACASGVRTRWFNLVSAVVVAIVIVVSMRLVGALLVSALLVFPAMSAMRIEKSFRAVTVLAAVFSVFCALSGILVAIMFGTPVGATIVAANAVLYAASRSRKSLLFAFGAVLLAFLALLFLPSRASHPSSGGARQPSAGRPKIVASVFPVYDWTRNVLGDRTNSVELVLLQKNGGDLHSFQPSARDIYDIATCDFFFYIGGEADAWAATVLEGNPNPGRRAIAMLETIPACPLHNGHDGDCNHHHADCRCDEHVWLSLKDASTCAGNIAAALGVDASAYIAEMQALDAEYAGAFSSGAAARRLLFADRFPFARMARDYGLECSAAFHGCSAEAEAGFDTVTRLAGEIAEHSIGAIYVLEDGDVRLAEAVKKAAARPDLPIRVLDSLQRVTKPQSTSYLETMRNNLRVLAQ